jgi:hypothetical protein
MMGGVKKRLRREHNSGQFGPPNVPILACPKLEIVYYSAFLRLKIIIVCTGQNKTSNAAPGAWHQVQRYLGIPDWELRATRKP